MAKKLKYNLDEIVDVKALQEMQDSFVQATGVTCVIVDQNKKRITKPSNPPNLCVKLARGGDAEVMYCQECDLKEVKKKIMYARQ
ncbi:MAG: PocR ligand-binding domain-containing protein [bacterium]|nr:PocR ligand-binding domain-containing protein [bacterium]